MGQKLGLTLKLIEVRKVLQTKSCIQSLAKFCVLRSPEFRAALNISLRLLPQQRSVLLSFSFTEQPSGKVSSTFENGTLISDFVTLLGKYPLDLMTKMQAVFSYVSDEVSLNLSFIPSEEYFQVWSDCHLCH